MGEILEDGYVPKEAKETEEVFYSEEDREEEEHTPFWIYEFGEEFKKENKVGSKENGTETGYWKQKAYENRVQQEKTEYLNVKEARDKKSALEKELESLKNQAKGESKKEGTVAIVASGMRGRSGTVVSSETQNRISELEKEISDLNKNINLAS